MSKPRIPFEVWPFSWGMKGQVRELAKAEYELEGEELERAKIDIIHGDDEDALKLALLDVELKHAKITQTEYHKQLATLNDEPWVTILSIETDPDAPSNGNIELDWNDEFVVYLQDHGYIGATEELVVDMWLGELCKNIALEHYSGIGSFDDDVESDGPRKQSTGEEGKYIIK